MGKIIRKTLADCKLTEADKKRLRELAARPDSEIDYSDIPPLTEKFWKNAIPNPYYRPVKQQITLRIDADILAWLRAQAPEGYQSRLNAVLRKVMLQELSTQTESSAQPTAKSAPQSASTARKGHRVTDTEERRPKQQRPDALNREEFEAEREAAPSLTALEGAMPNLDEVRRLRVGDLKGNSRSTP
jgi:uncharacterized protein (DUF4415 family)